ncbi:hypothetical protein L1987_24572 [Smallanthus sonchifolius]|uniref:Uncharacterized protein n=1 Tax=Smallanthus sonchifolius TaxID=185202 RepID=A0ACB9ING8_9ASTR|nr:hypothetical protein L1987_24572 [Smallanthus sonchifolius]
MSDEQYQMFVKFFSGTNVETKPEANMAGNRDDVWVVDSGCTEYITHQLNLLLNKKKTSNESPVVIPNGNAIPVEGRGELTLPGGAKLNEVLYVQNFKYNLLSVSRLSKDLQCAVTFFPDFFVMQGLRTRSLIIAGECRGGLYLMDMSKMKVGRRTTMTTMDTWHKRLGHASREKLSNVDFLESNSIKFSNVLCDSCAKAKHARTPFPTSYIKTTGCFELIHCDIWGGYRVPSYTRTNFFLTIVDDYSRSDADFVENMDLNLSPENQDEPTNGHPDLGPQNQNDLPNNQSEPDPRSKRTRSQPARLNDYLVKLPPLVDNSQPDSDQADSTVHPISHFVSYNKFSNSHKAFLTAIDSNDEPSCFEQATQDERWREAMQQEIKALKKNGTWILESLPEGK